MITKRTEDEINDQLNQAAEMEGASKWPGMTYEQGVEAALLWVMGQRAEPPMSDD